MSELIRVEGLTKHFGKVEAVRGIDFSIPAGLCFGLLGPNGAGKTTTIEMMEGITPPSSGRILFKGQPIDRHFRQKVGIQFQNTALPEFITVKETLKLFGAFYPQPRPWEEVVRLCRLEDILNRDNQKLSGGQKQRLLLGIALIPRPELLFLDEPTTGLDPQARRNFWELIRGIRAEGTTILLTTHYMDEAEELCDDIVLMDHGRILDQGSPADLLARHFQGTLIRLPRAGRGELPAGLSEGLKSTETLWEWETRDVESQLRRLLTAGLPLEGLSLHKPDLEDLFIHLTGSSLRA